MSALDPRITPARPDLAAAHLKGKVEAARFVKGHVRQVDRGRACVQSAPSYRAMQETELLFGELFTAYEIKDGWTWGQCALDGYVGYVRDDDLHEVSFEADHYVSALMTPLLTAPDLKTRLWDNLPLNAKVRIVSREKGYACIAPNLFVFERHLVPLGQAAPDWVAVAERFLGVPYVWGGKTQAGMDCSGLVQTALQASGRTSPRDTDMMEHALGQPCASNSPHARGDLIFWKGHVGVMLDDTRLLHANVFHMQVAVETLAEAMRRIGEIAGPVTSVRRLK